MFAVTSAHSLFEQSPWPFQDPGAPIQTPSFLQGGSHEKSDRHFHHSPADGHGLRARGGPAVAQGPAGLRSPAAPADLERLLRRSEPRRRLERQQRPQSGLRLLGSELSASAPAASPRTEHRHEPVLPAQQQPVGQQRRRHRRPADRLQLPVQPVDRGRRRDRFPGLEPERPGPQQLRLLSVALRQPRHLHGAMAP